MEWAPQPFLPETRREMAELLTGRSSYPSADEPISSHAQTGLLLPAFASLKRAILSDLEANLSKLLTLNTSRRETVARYLDRLAGQASGPSTLAGSLDAAGGLRRWIDGPRSPAQNVALQSFFEEVALVTLGQVLLLKAWSDRNLRRWSQADVKDLNWALNCALKGAIQPGRENWQIACKTIYSWYKPAPAIQQEIWDIVAAWKIGAEGPGFLLSLLAGARHARPENHDPQGYDQRLYQALWEQMPQFGFQPSSLPPGPIKRNWIAFTPTLRDGALARSAPGTVTWVGLEASPFHILVAELLQLWWGAAPPPLWSPGTGLEVHTRDQLSLDLGSPKPSLLSRIAEMEACDVAFVLEERPVRAQGRSIDSQAFRDQVEGLPYFKKLRAPGTSLGDLQACVALSKLRPGGLLFWAREEPLTETDGREVLNFLLERAKLVSEWDFSELDHALPSLPGAAPLFPGHLYLFVRESQVEARLTHRPTRVVVAGQLRSHVEVPTLLAEALQAGAPANAGALSTDRPITLGSGRIHAQKSPSPQRDWMERWPDPTCQQLLKTLDRLRDYSLPLAAAMTVRPTPEGDPERDHRWKLPAGLKGLWIQGSVTGEKRRLSARELPDSSKKEEGHGSGYLVLVPEASWSFPIARYLESEAVRVWLDHHAERRGDRWVLNEQVVRAIPIPKSLLQALGFSGVEAQDGDPEIAARVSEILNRPSIASEILTQWSDDPRGASLRASLFVNASWALEKLEASTARFMPLVTSAGRIRWGELLKLLPPSECVPVTVHPKIATAGNLPLHMAIGRIERVKAPGPGVFFATEAGFHLSLTSENPNLLDMVWDQVEGLSSPTWSELISYVRVPRRIDLAETTASDVLRLHGEHSRRMAELSTVLEAISLA